MTVIYTSMWQQSEYSMDNQCLQGPRWITLVIHERANNTLAIHQQSPTNRVDAEHKTKKMCGAFLVLCFLLLMEHGAM
uniref:Uncharacterized protein n=1 Tax=Arundo donax TaxID=35708 RepID=A0A0A9UAS8_ARUDO